MGAFIRGFLGHGCGRWGDGPDIFSPGAGAQLLPPPCPGSLCLASVSLPPSGLWGKGPSWAWFSFPQFCSLRGAATGGPRATGDSGRTVTTSTPFVSSPSHLTSIFQIHHLIGEGRATLQPDWGVV